MNPLRLRKLQNYEVLPAGERPPPCMGYRRDSMFGEAKECDRRATVAVRRFDRLDLLYLCDECAEGWH